jgi:hypothetical protein
MIDFEVHWLQANARYGNGKGAHMDKPLLPMAHKKR